MSLPLFSDVGQDAAQDCDPREKRNGQAGLQASVQGLVSARGGDRPTGAQGH